MASALGAGIFAGYVFVIPGLAAISIAGLLGVPLGTYLLFGIVIGPLTALITSITMRLLLGGRLWKPESDEDVDEALTELEAHELAVVGAEAGVAGAGTGAADAEAGTTGAGARAADVSTTDTQARVPHHLGGNSNFFWMFKALLGLSTKGSLKTLTVATSVASLVSLPMVIVASLIA